MGTRAYALVGFFIISVLFTQYAFADFHGCGPNEIRDVTGECVSAFADESAETGMEVSVNAFEGSTTISVSGHSSVKNNDVTIMVQAPNGNIVAVYLISPDANGDFMKDVQVGGSQWEQNGMYTVKVQQGSSSLHAFTFQVEIVNGYTSATSLTQSTLQVAPTITVSTDKSTYDHSSTIFVNGKVTNPTSETLVNLIVIGPTNNIITIDVFSLDTYGNFNTRLSTVGNLWKYDGVYTIKVQYGGEAVNNKVLVELTGGTTTPKLFSSNPRLLDAFGNPVYSVSVGQQVQIAVDLENPNNFDQPFVYYLMVRESGDEAWITGSLSPGQSFSPALSWDPSIARTYTIDITIFDDIQRRNVLAPTLTITQVVGGTTIICGPNQVFQAGVCRDIGVPEPEPEPSGIVDTTPPLLLTPSDMTVDATDSSGARVDYSVKAIDDEDGVLRPNCLPSSGSLFHIGKTTVTCSATDYSGNSARKSFLITVNSPDVLIPSWVRDVAGFWCGDEIDDSSFIEAIQYLIDNDVIIVPTTASSGSGAQEIPNWIKNNACWWAQGLISNSDFASGLQYLIGQGIIRV